MKNGYIIAIINFKTLIKIFFNKLAIDFNNEHLKSEILDLEKFRHCNLIFINRIGSVIERDVHYSLFNKISNTVLACIFATIPTLGANGGFSSETSDFSSPQIYKFSDCLN